MVSSSDQSRILATKRAMVMLLWMLAGGVAVGYKAMQYVGVRGPSSGGSSGVRHKGTVHRRANPATMALDVDSTLDVAVESTVRKSVGTIQKPQRAESGDVQKFGGFLVGGVAAMMCVASVTTTISMLQGSSDAEQRNRIATPAKPQVTAVRTVDQARPKVAPQNVQSQVGSLSASAGQTISVIDKSETISPPASVLATVPITSQQSVKPQIISSGTASKMAAPRQVTGTVAANNGTATPVMTDTAVKPVAMEVVVAPAVTAAKPAAPLVEIVKRSFSTAIPFTLDADVEQAVIARVAPVQKKEHVLVNALQLQSTAISLSSPNFKKAAAPVEEAIVKAATVKKTTSRPSISPVRGPASSMKKTSDAIPEAWAKAGKKNVTAVVKPSASQATEEGKVPILMQMLNHVTKTDSVAVTQGGAATVAVKPKVDLVPQAKVPVLMAAVNHLIGVPMQGSIPMPQKQAVVPPVVTHVASSHVVAKEEATPPSGPLDILLGAISPRFTKVDHSVTLKPVIASKAVQIEAVAPVEEAIVKAGPVKKNLSRPSVSPVRGPASSKGWASMKMTADGIPEAWAKAGKKNVTAVVKPSASQAIEEGKVPILMQMLNHVAKTDSVAVTPGGAATVVVKPNADLVPQAKVPVLMAAVNNLVAGFSAQDGGVATVALKPQADVVPQAKVPVLVSAVNSLLGVPMQGSVPMPQKQAAVAPVVTQADFNASVVSHMVAGFSAHDGGAAAVASKPQASPLSVPIHAAVAQTPASPSVVTRSVVAPQILAVQQAVVAKPEAIKPVLLTPAIVTPAPVAAPAVVAPAVEEKKIVAPTTTSLKESMPCSSKWPIVGDSVSSNAGRKFDADWSLEEGEVATVVDVDRDGDFRLQNATGNVSNWVFSKHYVYHNAPVPVVTV